MTPEREWITRCQKDVRRKRKRWWNGIRSNIACDEPGHRFSAQQVDYELGGLIRAVEAISRNRRHLQQSVCRRQLLAREAGLDG